MGFKQSSSSWWAVFLFHPKYKFLLLSWSYGRPLQFCLKFLKLGERFLVRFIVKFIYSNWFFLVVTDFLLRVGLLLLLCQVTKKAMTKIEVKLFLLDSIYISCPCLLTPITSDIISLVIYYSTIRYLRFTSCQVSPSDQISRLKRKTTADKRTEVFSCSYVVYL